MAVRSKTFFGEVVCKLQTSILQALQNCKKLFLTESGSCCDECRNVCNAIIVFCIQQIPMKLDLGSIQSIKEFYHEIIKTFDTIDILVNNAGVLIPSDNIERTADGFEAHFGINHLGHFLLTNLLLPLLKNSENSRYCKQPYLPCLVFIYLSHKKLTSFIFMNSLIFCRIIILTSGTFRSAQLEFDDLNWEKGLINYKSHDVGDYPLYKSSKLANVLFAKELTKRLEGTGVRVYSVCPGNVMTSIGRRVQIPLLFLIFKVPFILLTIKTAKQAIKFLLNYFLSTTWELPNKISIHLVDRLVQL